MTRRPSPRRRLAAALAVVVGAATLIVALIALVENLLAGVAVVGGLALAIACAWQGVLGRGLARGMWVLAAIVAVAAALYTLAAEDLLADLLLVGAGIAITAGAIRVAFGHRGAAGGGWRAVLPSRQAVLLVNPRSGDGKAERARLADHARARGVRPVVLADGDDLEELAREAVAAGADALGMAGGDGSQATVAAVAAEHDLPFVCVPAGTRNHFALDLGVRRNDPVGALDAFTDSVEQRIDLGEVNGVVFVNNVSLGVYPRAIRQSRYRAAKLRTLVDAARAVLGPGGEVPEMRFTDDTGQQHGQAAVVLVSNNPYAVDRVLGLGTRPRLDSGRLGVVVLGGPGGQDRAWSARTFEVTGRPPAYAGVDGEAVTLDPPLVLRSRPRALRVRISSRHPGVSPSALLPRRLRLVVPRLARIATGRG